MNSLIEHGISVLIEYENSLEWPWLNYIYWGEGAWEKDKWVKHLIVSLAVEAQLP